MQRSYLSVGKEFTDTPEKQVKLAAAIKKLQWFDLPAKDLPFSQGYALQELIKHMGRNPDKVAHGIMEDRYALLAMRNNYEKGEVRRATVYSIDNGCEVINVAVDTETEEEIQIKTT